MNKSQMHHSLPLVLFSLLFLCLALPQPVYAKSTSKKARRNSQPAQQQRGIYQDTRKAHDPIPADGYIRVTDNRQVIDPPPPRRGFGAPLPPPPPPPQSMRRRPPKGTYPVPEYIKVTDNRQVIGPPEQSSTKPPRLKGGTHRKHKHRKHSHKIRKN